MFVHPNSNEQRYLPFPPNYYRFAQQPQPQFYTYYQQQPFYNAASFMLPPPPPPPPSPPFFHQTYPQHHHYNNPTNNYYQEQQPRMTYYEDEHDDDQPQNAPVFVPCSQQQDLATQFPPLQLPRRVRSSKQNHAAFVKRETRKVLFVRVACAIILQLFEKYKPEEFNKLATFIQKPLAKLIAFFEQRLAPSTDCKDVNQTGSFFFSCNFFVCVL